MTAEPLPLDLDDTAPDPDVRAFAAARSVMPEAAPPWGTAGEAAHLAGRCDEAKCVLCARAEAMRGGL